MAVPERTKVAVTSATKVAVDKSAFPVDRGGREMGDARCHPNARDAGKLLRMPRQQTLVQKRLLDAAELLRDGDAEVTFQHSIFCQVSLPYRDPGDDVREWDTGTGSRLTTDLRPACP